MSTLSSFKIASSSKAQDELKCAEIIKKWINITKKDNNAFKDVEWNDFIEISREEHKKSKIQAL